MRLNVITFFVTITIINSCGGQINSHSVASEKQDNNRISGDTVDGLDQNIMVIYQDKKSNYWFGSWKNGLYRYDGNSITHFTIRHGLPDNRVEEIKEDNQGNIYINTSNGLCKYDGINFLLLNGTVDSNNQWELKPDDLWFKCLEQPGYVYRLDGNKLSKLKLPTTILGEDYIRAHPNYPNPYSIYCIYKDSQQNIWFGTATLGVCRYDGKSFDWISEPDVTEIHDGPANGVRSIAEDKNGDFWFNTDFRYSVYNRAPSRKSTNKQIEFYDRVKSVGCLDGKTDGHLNEYLSIVKDNENHLWFATYLNGVWRYDGAEIHHYPIQVNDKNIPIYCLFKDNSGSIWLGTHENGVFKFNGHTFEKFDI